MEVLDYERGRLGHITRFVDSGFLTITLDDYKDATPFQLQAWAIIDFQIRKWRSKHEPLVTI